MDRLAPWWFYLLQTSISQLFWKKLKLSLIIYNMNNFDQIVESQTRTSNGSLLSMFKSTKIEWFNNSSIANCFVDQKFFWMLWPYHIYHKKKVIESGIYSQSIIFWEIRKTEYKCTKNLLERIMKAIYRYNWAQ